MVVVQIGAAYRRPEFQFLSSPPSAQLRTGAGTNNTGVCYCYGCGRSFSQQLTSVVMDPGSRFHLRSSSYGGQVACPGRRLLHIQRPRYAISQEPAGTLTFQVIAGMTEIRKTPMQRNSE